jgi:hypothetical protein
MRIGQIEDVHEEEVLADKDFENLFELLYCSDLLCRLYILPVASGYLFWWGQEEPNKGSQAFCLISTGTEKKP